MEFDLERVRANVRNALTEDLLDRATVYRAGLEPDALPVILEELRARGVTADDVVAHEGARGDVIRDPAGAAHICHRCRRPAVVREWGWHRLFGRLPIFRRPLYHCDEHRTNVQAEDRAPD